MTTLKPIALAVAFLLAFIAGLSPLSAAQIETKAKWAIMLDYDSGTLLLEKNADEPMPPASMSKLMTLAIVFRAMKNGELSLDDEFSVSEYAWRTGGAPSGTSAMMIPLHSTVKLSELIPGITVQSGNDACIVIAEGMSGSEPAFADVMNEYAKEIGLKDSTFANSTGLPDPVQMMSARDLAKLAVHIIREYPDYYHYFAQKEFKWRKHKPFANRNPLMFTNIGADGLKTGYISASGYGITASAKKAGQRLVLVLNGMKSKRERLAESRKILEWGFRTFRPITVFNQGDSVGHAKVWGGIKGEVELVAKTDLNVLMPRTARRKLKAEIVYSGPLKAPIKKGDKVATLRVSSPGTVTNELPLYAGETVEQGNAFQRGFSTLYYLTLGKLL